MRPTALIKAEVWPYPDLGPLLAQLQTLPFEKLEDLTEAIFGRAEVSELTEWLRQQQVEFN